MCEPTGDEDQRVLILAPTMKDAVTTRELLAPAGIPSVICTSLDRLIAEIERGAATILIPEEAVSAGSEQLAEIVAKQPAWSDLPMLILARPGASSGDVADAVQTLGNVMVLERPLRVATLLSAIRTAVRARERQYEIRGYLEERLRTEEALRAADRRKDEFLATLGHELRNPLAPIRSVLHLLKRAGDADPGTHEAVEIMERQVHHLIRLVDDLLEVSRITRGLIELQKETVDLTAILRTSVETSMPLFDLAHQELIVSLPPNPIPVEGDQLRLTQVFANLLNNASRYSNPEGRVWLDASSTGGLAVVSVRDEGIGIAASDLGSVFDMFTQVDRSDRRNQSGLGIGLTLARDLVAAHGGQVEARSDGLGTGSEFVVRLPMVTAGPEWLADGEESPRFPPRRLMIVDDNPDVAAALALLLTELGGTVLTKHSGREALEALDEFQPDAMLLDIGMPGMDGYEVARRVRASSDHASLVLIALTGWGAEADRERTREAGFDHHLVKPVDLDQLGAILEAIPPRDAVRTDEMQIGAETSALDAG